MEHLWKTQPRGGALKAMAIFNALIAKSRFIRLLKAEPMTRRECRSRSEPLSAIAMKFCSSKFGAMLQV